MKKKVLYVARLFSGLEISLSSRDWNPTGVPTIYKVINEIDKEFDTKFIFTAKDYEEEFFPVKSETIYVNKLKSPITIIAGIIVFPVWLGKYRKYLREIYQSLYIIVIAMKFRPDIVYIGNANIWTGAILAKFGNRFKVVFRVMGLYQAMRDALTENTIWHKILRWSYKAPFSAAIVTQDGTGVEPWVDSALNKKVPVHIMLNGIPAIKNNIKISHNKLLDLPKDKTIVLFLGRLEPEKGCFEFIYQFLRAESVISNQIHALIVGSGRSEQDIHNIIIEKNALDKVTFIKRLDHSQVLEAHKCADIYVSLNKRGNLSNANLEAMALGQCIVMLESQPKLSIDSITDSLIPNQAVLRVSLENNISELKDAIVMLHNNPEIREKMKKNIRKVSDKILKSWDERISHEIKILKSMF